MFGRKKKPKKQHQALPYILDRVQREMTDIDDNPRKYRRTLPSDIPRLPRGVYHHEIDTDYLEQLHPSLRRFWRIIDFEKWEQMQQPEEPKEPTREEIYAKHGIELTEEKKTAAKALILSDQEPSIQESEENG